MTTLGDLDLAWASVDLLQLGRSGPRLGREIPRRGTRDASPKADVQEGNVMIKSSIETRQSVRRGAVAGVAAGIFLTLMMTAMSAAGGQDIWYGMKGASAPFFGTRAMRPGFDALTVIIGLVCHFLVSAIWGALFAIVVEGWNRSLAAITGILWGFVVWIGMYYVVLPVVGLSSMVGDAPVGRAIAFHLMFSVVMTGVYLIYPAIFPRGPRLHRSIHAV